MKPTGANGDRWNAYRRWNDALAEVIYGPDSEGVPAYLDLEDGVLALAAERAGSQGDPRDDLVAAVRATLGPLGISNLIFAPHLRGLQGWRAASGKPPPIIALLAVMCLAAEDMRADAGVSGNNYYERLMPVLGANPIHKTRVVTAYRSSALTLWGTLNNWLEDLQGARGLPTAYSFSHEYIGLPMSQALVRGVERDQLRALFADLGLPARGRLSAPDMRAVLDQRVRDRRAPISNVLRTLWANAAARERIVDVACQLLASWEPREEGTTCSALGHGPGAPRARPRGVQLTARVVSFPVPSLELGVVGYGRLQPPGLDLTTTDSDDHPTTASLPTEALPGERWAISDPQRLDADSLLAGHLQLKHADGALYERRPRRLIPFTRDDLLQSFIEGERLTLGADGMLLCTEQLADAVERALGQVARPGFQRRPAPFDDNVTWTLFSGVQVLAPLPEHDPLTGRVWGDDLNVLQPLADGQVLLEGGLQFPGRVRRWSSLAPPELRIVTSQAERMHVTIRQTRALGDAEEEREQALTGPTALIDLSYLGLPDGDYEIRVSAGSGTGKLSPLDQALLRLRSADIPNPLAPPQEPIPLVPRESEPRQLSGSARTMTTATNTSSVVPAWWSARQQHDRGATSAAQPERLRLVVAGRPTAPCFETGRHHLDYPTFYGHAGSGSIEGTCRGCGLVKRSPASYRPTRGHTPRTVQTGPVLRAAGIPPVQPSSALNPDTVLDALSHDVRGPLSGIDRLAAQLEDSALFTSELTHKLLSLGHLVLGPSPDDPARTDWEVTASSLQQAGTDTFVLTGARSRALLKALTDAADSTALKTQRDHQVAAPARVLVHASQALAREVVDRLAEAGHRVDLSLQTPEQLADAAPAMGSLVADLPRQVAASASSVQRWDNSVARWKSAVTFSAPGAYRLQTGGRSIYCLRDADDVDAGTMQVGDVATIKHGAALLSQAPLAGYNAEAQALYVPLGADLPAPYARTATACSGLVPQRDRGLLLYRDVPPAIASRLHELLTR